MQISGELNTPKDRMEQGSYECSGTTASKAGDRTEWELDQGEDMYGSVGCGIVNMCSSWWGTKE